MQANEEDYIDLQKLSTKQLLLRLLDRVDNITEHIERLEKDHKENQRLNDDRHIQMVARIAVLETVAEMKGRNAGMLWAFIVSLVVSVITWLLNLKLK